MSNILREIENKILVPNPNVATNLKPLCTVSIVYKTSSNESRIFQGAIVLSVNRLSVKVALINSNDSNNTIVRTFYFHSPLVLSIKIEQFPKRRRVKSKYYHLIKKNTKAIKKIING